MHRVLECQNKNDGCEARGEMFKGKKDEWLFVVNNYPHNHEPPNEDQSTNVHKFEYDSTDA